jgi:hypothetical protein
MFLRPLAVATALALAASQPAQAKVGHFFNLDVAEVGDGRVSTSLFETSVLPGSGQRMYGQIFYDGLNFDSAFLSNVNYYNENLYYLKGGLADLWGDESDGYIPVTLNRARPGLLTFEINFFSSYDYGPQYCFDTKGLCRETYTALALDLFELNFSLDGSGRSPSVTAVIYDPTTTPEPATWALMLLGFGATGAALRRAARRKLA